MKRVTILFAILALCGTAGVFWQRQSLSHLWKTSEETRADPISEPSANSLSAVELEREATMLRGETKDLPKLRNEIGQLRAQQSELAAARDENERLLRAKKSGAPVPREVPPGFVAKEQLRNAGYETPEDAIQTFFWAMREGNAAVAMESLSPESQQRIRWESASPEQRAALELKARGGAPEMKQFNDFTVAERKQISEDRVTLYLRSSFNTNTVNFELRRLGTEWKLMDF